MFTDGGKHLILNRFQTGPHNHVFWGKNQHGTFDISKTNL